MDYTKHHEDVMYQMSIREQNEEIFEEDILEYLRDETAFANFGDGLRRLIRKKMPEGYTSDELSFLKDMAEKNSIKFNRNTLNNWFDGTAPKKGDKDRERMFLVCFALEFTIAETEELFRKVYCDREFNMRNYREFVYYCCLNNGWAYEKAEELIKKISFSAQETDATIYTRLLQKTAQELRTEEEILTYITSHKHNFDIKNRTARQTLDTLLFQVQGRKGEAEALKTESIDENSSYVAQECVHNMWLWEELKEYNGIYTEAEEEYYRNKKRETKKSFFSIATMVDIIYGINLKDAEMESEKSLIQNSNLPQAVRGRFPREEIFRKKEPTSEEYRKMIILLYSYQFWVKKIYGDEELSFEEYRDGLNDVLHETYLHRLYIGNPFDWIFLYCTLSEDPLSLFRALIGEGLLGE